MGKQIVYTKITPLPSNVPRQLALDLLHSHEEVIKMNPLVTEVKSVDPPRNAAADEYFSNWYEITEIITWGFGMKKKIMFKGVFHDQPWGMQSHVFAPLNTDMRQTYRIGGNQPGEPREPRELGIDTPLDGLYLREEVNIMCNTPFAAGFVKKEMAASSKTMIDRITRKAELLDEGKLHAMFENGKLKTSKPTGDAPFLGPPPSPGISDPGSPGPLGSPGLYNVRSPNIDSKGFGKYYDVAGPERNGSTLRSNSYLPQYQQAGYQGPEYAKPGSQPNFVSELPGSYYHPQEPNNSLYPQPLRPNGQAQPSFRAELAGDTTLQPPSSENVEEKRTPQLAASHPANQYQNFSRNPHRSPTPNQTRPRTENGPSRNSSNSGYQVTNPDAAPTRSNRSSSNVEQWQRSVQGDRPIDDAYYRNSRHSHHNSNTVEPDHQRFSNLSVSQSADDIGQASSTLKCPVCGLFEGDEAAVSHHVSKAHFK